MSQRILGSRDLSYGLYIYHAPVILALVRSGVPAGWLSVAAAVLLSLACAALSWSCVERPFLERKRIALHPVGGDPGGADGAEPAEG